MKKMTISISIPCFNEQDNVIPLAEDIIAMFAADMPEYDYEIVYIDNCSQDETRNNLRLLCKKHSKVKAIFNVKNFAGIGFSGYHNMLQTTGDCTVLIHSDFQTPVSIIPRLVAEWEKGYKIVCAVKTSSKESRLMWFVRSLYYKMLSSGSELKVIEHFIGLGLYDKAFLNVLREINDPCPSLLQQVALLGYKVTTVEFLQGKRHSGKSKSNFLNLVNAAITRFVAMSTIGPNVAMVVGFFVSVLSLVVGFVYLVMKLLFWQNFSAGMAPLILLVSFLGAVQIFLIGLIGQYVIKNSQRLMGHPHVIEEERINFDMGSRDETD
jgi:glycosyltransferase involved in cell wall biosynthesis